MKRGLVFVAAAALLLSGCSSEEEPEPEAEPESGHVIDWDSLMSHEPEEPESLSAFGGILLTPEASLVTADDRCISSSFLTDLNERLRELRDAQVVITDASGSVVATAEMEASVVNEACAWTFETEVPTGGEFYEARAASFSSDIVRESDAQNGELIFDMNEG